MELPIKIVDKAPGPIMGSEGARVEINGVDVSGYVTSYTIERNVDDLSKLT